jgi:hypothetical protein
MDRDPRLRRLAAKFSEPDFDAGDEPPARDGGLFVWTVVIILLGGLAIACWIGSFYIFEHPEKPLSYQVLNRLKKLEPPKRFELTSAPRGEFLKPAQLLERYEKMTPRELMRANEALIRNYLRNYRLSPDLVVYVVGTFNILDSFELTKDDFFGSGVVALARSKETPKVLIEQVFPAQPKVVQSLQRTLLTGLDFDLKRENELSALLHVEKIGDGRIKVTTVSILYPNYGSTAAAGTFSLEPPEVLNVASGLPVVGGERRRTAETKHSAFQRRVGLGNVSPGATPESRLVRVERPSPVGTPVPAAQPEPTVLPAIPVATPVAGATPTPSATPAALASATPVATPAATSSAAPVAAASATPSATPAPPDAQATNWPVYAPGRMPRGRLLGVKDVSSKGSGGIGGERAYLQGNFVVKAVGPDRAVLRAQGALTDALGLGGRSGNVRVIVMFPPGMRPPAEGSTFSRDAQRPFQITEIRESEDGQVNVYVREVTRP